MSQPSQGKVDRVEPDLKESFTDMGCVAPKLKQPQNATVQLTVDFDCIDQAYVKESILWFDESSAYQCQLEIEVI